MPAVRVDRAALGHWARVAALPGLPGTGVGDRRDYLRENKEAFADVVLDDVVRHISEARSERSWAAKSSWTGKLQNSLDLAPQAQEGNG